MRGGREGIVGGIRRVHRIERGREGLEGGLVNAVCVLGGKQIDASERIKK